MATRTDKCDVKITVSDNTPKEFHIDLSEEPIDLTKYDDDVAITWTIVSTRGDWNFVKDTPSTKKGVKIKSAGSAFAYHPTTNPKKDQRWKRTNRNGRRYKYTISIERADGTRITLDPIIIND